MRKLWFVAACVVFILLVALGAIPGAADTLSARYGDKLLHAIAYSVLSVLYFNAYRGSKLVRSSATIATIALLGAGDETVQSFLPYRNASLADWCFDVASALLIVLFLSWRTQANPRQIGNAIHTN